MARILATALFAFLLLSGNQARACSCTALTPERSAEIIAGAELIFEGRIVSLETREQPEEDFDYTSPVPVPQSPLYSRAKLRILAPYKGAPAGEKIEAYIDTLTSCGYMLQVGDVTDFVLTRKDNVLVQAGQCDMPGAAGWQTLKAAQLEQ